MLDEATVDVDHQRHWDTVGTSPHLCQLKRNSTVRSTKFSFASLLIFNHFETEMLMACHSLITKYLPQHFLQRAKP